MKHYTSIEQSKKLLELGLNPDSADMWYQHTGISIKDGSRKSIYFPMVIRDNESEEDIPCWSLAALLECLDSDITKENEETLKLHIEKEEFQYYLYYENLDTGEMFEIETDMYDDLVDACMAMIEKLHKLNLL